MSRYDELIKGWPAERLASALGVLSGFIAARKGYSSPISTEEFKALQGNSEDALTVCGARLLDLSDNPDT